MVKERLKSRKTKIWRSDYLSCFFMCKNIEWAVNQASLVSNNSLKNVLDVGCGNKPYADLFEGHNYRGLDCTTINSLPDIIGSAMDIPVESDTVDIVFSTQVIEHVPSPSEMINECFRVLKPAGILILTGPFYWPLHEEPYDFYRFTKYGFEYLLKDAGFSSWEIKGDGGDWAQIFLSLNLKLSGKLLFPARILLNLTGLMLNRLYPSELSPSNYTILAIK